MEHPGVFLPRKASLPGPCGLAAHTLELLLGAGGSQQHVCQEGKVFAGTRELREHDGGEPQLLSLVGEQHLITAGPPSQGEHDF